GDANDLLFSGTATACGGAPLPREGSGGTALGDEATAAAAGQADGDAIVGDRESLGRSSGGRGGHAEASARAVVGSGGGRWDVVDVDPFGSCLPFLEGAVAAVEDGGVLAVAATDLTVLCGKGRGRQKCLRQYRASVANTPYAKEAAMRVLLHRLDVAARRGGRRMVPLLCVALEFYVRLFVRIVPAKDVGGGRDAAFELPPPPLLIKQLVHSPEFRCYRSSTSSSSSSSSSPSINIGSSGHNGGAGGGGGGMTRLPSAHDREQREAFADSNSKVVENGPELVVEGDAASLTGGADDHDGLEDGPDMGVETDTDKKKRSDTRIGPQEGDGRGRGLNPGTSSTGNADSREEGLALGPFWPGRLFDPGFVDDVLAEIYRSSASPAAAPAPAPAPAPIPPPAGVATGRSSSLAGSAGADREAPLALSTKGQLVFLLEALSEELPDCPLFYSLPDVALSCGEGARTGDGCGWGGGGAESSAGTDFGGMGR
ncbi:unnamed protein product, partial [Scytosiphon promiscuus]